MPRTPDRYAGVRDEEAIVFFTDVVVPSENGELRYVAGQGFRFYEEGIERGLDLLQGRTSFGIWAEENATLNDGAYEWAFGNGDDTVQGSGIPVPFACFLFAVSLDHNTTASATVGIQVDGVQVASVTTSSERSTFAVLGAPVAVNAGQVVGFQTITGPGSGSGNRVAAFFRTSNESGILAPVDSVFGRVGAVVAEASDYNAGQVDYDNTTSGLTATEVQGAIDELAASPGGGITEAEHEALNTLVHDTVPFDLFEEYTYTGFRVTGVITWTDATKVLKKRELQITYTGARVTSAVSIVYDDFGVEIYRLTDTYTYTGARLSSVSRVRTP